jgi:hypothetical protein
MDFLDTVDFDVNDAEHFINKDRIEKALTGAVIPATDLVVLV